MVLSIYIHFYSRQAAAEHTRVRLISVVPPPPEFHLNVATRYITYINLH